MIFIIIVEDYIIHGFQEEFPVPEELWAFPIYLVQHA
jgi:hypothetical protein